MDFALRFGLFIGLWTFQRTLLWTFRLFIGLCLGLLDFVLGFGLFIGLCLGLWTFYWTLDPFYFYQRPNFLPMLRLSILAEIFFLKRSRCELLVFAQANPARLPVTMGILQPNIPVRRMMSERRTKLTDALVRVLCRLLTPIGVVLPGPHDEYMRDSLLSLARHGDGHVLTVAVALLLAILTGRSDLCIAGVFGAGKTRSLAVLLIALSCELSDFYAIVYTKENVAAKAL